MNLIKINNRFSLFRLLIIYLLLMSGFLFWPYDFDFYRDNNAEWILESNGIELSKRGFVIADKTNKLFEKIKNGKGITIEMWIEPGNTCQTGPARIISYSIDPFYRNFTIGQSENNLTFRLRTLGSDLNGVEQELEIKNVFTEKRIYHVAATYDFERKCVYVNGDVRTCNEQKGDFSNWDSSYKLIMGNEVTGNRQWSGKIFYAAIYNKALNQETLLNNFKYGYAKTLTTKCLLMDLNNQPDFLYLFDEKIGNLVYDKGFNGVEINLYKPVKIPDEWGGGIIGLSFKQNFEDIFDINNIIVNFIVFFPFGILLGAYLKTYIFSNFRFIATGMAIAIVISLFIEYLHYYLPRQHSSSGEVFLKASLSSIGIVVFLFFVWLCEQSSKSFSRKEKR